MASDVRSAHPGFLPALLVGALAVAGSSGLHGSAGDTPASRSRARLVRPRASAPNALVQPSEVVYRGAFRLPAGGARPLTFEYGGNAATYNPDGDPAGGGDGWPGSLFVSGHDRISFDVPNGGQVAEITIPAPVIAPDVADLPEAQFVQGFADVTAGLFAGIDEIPRMGLQYLNHPASGPGIHLAWGQHLEEPRHPTHAMFGPVLSTPDTRGAWYVDGVSLYSVNDYLLEIPADWASAHSLGRSLATGRFKDGGWSGKGPALHAYVPWIDAGGTLPPSGTELAATTLLHYESSETNSDVTHASLSQYQHPDEWAGGAWVTTGSGQSAVLIVGNKSLGAKYWYGWVHPSGPEYPCVETEYVNQFTVCWTAAGTPCPPSDLTGCTGHNDFRGWWTSVFTGRILFYDPADLARVAAGTMAPHEPQPYATLDIEPHIFANPSGVETEMIGTGAQRRYKFGSVAFDRQRNALFVLELFADGAAPVVHVFSVVGSGCTVQTPTITSNSPVPVGSTINLSAPSVAGATYSWTGPNGFSSALQNPTIPNATVAMAGTYSLTVTVSGCTSLPGTTNVVVTGAPANLTVTKLGAGSGTVVSDPAGIDCGSACSAPFAFGTVVTLTASPLAGSRFAGWAGGGCAGTGPCSVTMNAATVVTPAFLTTDPSRFYALTPCRIVDTRTLPEGPLAGPALQPGATRTFTISGGPCSVPSDAVAISGNVTVAVPVQAGHVTLFPADQAPPLTSTLSFAAGRTRANNTVMPLSFDGTGAIKVFNGSLGTVDFILDVNGYFR